MRIGECRDSTGEMLESGKFFFLFCTFGTRGGMKQQLTVAQDRLKELIPRVAFFI